jgi:hypothetical protein
MPIERSALNGGCLLMSKTRLIIAGLLVVLTGGVVASASAEPPPPTSCKAAGTPSYCVEGVALVSSSEEVEGTNSGASILKGTIGGVTSEVKCEKGKLTGLIEGGAVGTAGKSTAIMTLEECKLVTPTNCKLTSKKIETAGLKGGLTGGGAKRIEDKFEPKEGTMFTSFGIEGKESSCVIAHVGEEIGFAVSGSQVCEVDTSNTEAETEATTHKIKCVAAGGLEIGTNPAEITSEVIVKLKSGKKWSVKET